MIPICRARQFDGDLNIVGYYVYSCDGHFILPLGKHPSCEFSDDYHQIDPKTLAIHFPDMLDSEGNKIFASLQEDGRGGDILNCWIGIDTNQEPTRKNLVIRYYQTFYIGFRSYDICSYRSLKVIGIKA